MPTEISPELRQVVEATEGPLEVVDSQTNRHYVLIRAEVFDRIKDLLDWDEPSDAERRAAWQRFGRSLGWESPEADDLV